MYAMALDAQPSEPLNKNEHADTNTNVNNASKPETNGHESYPDTYKQ